MDDSVSHIYIYIYRDDGWWEAENKQGDKGVVPSTFLQVANIFIQIDFSLYTGTKKNLLHVLSNKPL